MTCTPRVLRPYQAECVAKILARLDDVNSVLAVLATGLGKTVIGSALIQQWPLGRVLWLANRDELIQQAAASIEHATGEPPAIEMADSYSVEDGFMKARVVVSSVQTLCRPKRQRRFRPQEFGLIVIDEAHHATARTYRQIVSYFREGDAEQSIAGNPSCKLVGVTATPKRSDDLALGAVFDAVAYDYPIAAAVQDGWLVPVRQKVVVVEGLDFANLDTIAGDFDQEELEAILVQEPILHKMAVPSVDLAGQRQALVFCVGVAQAKLMAAVLNRYAPGKAKWVAGETPKDERKDTVGAYKAGHLQFLVNCGVFLEGFDAPATALVVMARPTQSLSLYVQMLGRGTRPLPGLVEGLPDAFARRQAILSSPKPYMDVLDFVGNVDEHASSATVNAADVLGGNYDLPTRQYAKKTIAEEQSAAGIEEALERADAELALEREEERRKKIVAQVEYRVREVATTEAGPAREAPRTSAREPITDKQLRYLLHLGVPYETAIGYHKRQAGAVISSLVEKEKVG